jgi:hypothetical protein
VNFAKAEFFSQAIQSAVHAESAQGIILETGNIAFCKVFFHHASGPVTTNSAKIYVQETRAEYHTLAARQDEYRPQDSQSTYGFQGQERAAEQSATRPIRPTNKSSESLKMKLPNGTVFNMWGTPRNTLHTLLPFYVSSSSS